MDPGLFGQTRIVIFIVGVLYDPCCCDCLKYGVLSCGVSFAVRNELQKM
jgi:hypothetical protein